MYTSPVYILSFTLLVSRVGKLFQVVKMHGSACSVLAFRCSR